MYNIIAHCSRGHFGRRQSGVYFVFIVANKTKLLEALVAHRAEVATSSRFQKGRRKSLDLWARTSKIQTASIMIVTVKIARFSQWFRIIFTMVCRPRAPSAPVASACITARLFPKCTHKPNNVSVSDRGLRGPEVFAEFLAIATGDNGYLPYLHAS